MDIDKNISILQILEVSVGELFEEANDEKDSNQKDSQK